MSQAGGSGPDRLRVLSVVSDGAVAELVRAVFAHAGDEVTSLTDMALGVASARAFAPDLVLVDVSMQQRAGLALVHHIKAVTGEAEVYALTRGNELDAGSQAVSLGASGVIVYPPSGDELLVAAKAVRERRASERLRAELRREAEASRRAMSYALRIANLAGGNDRERAALSVTELFREATGAVLTALYLPAGEGSVELRRAVVLGALDEGQSFTDEMGLLRYARAAKLDVVPLTAGQIAAGYVLLGGAPRTPDGEPRLPLTMLAAQAATTLALVSERERAGRAAIKDPLSSAYTFAYFVDVAGREIDKAQRHGRRFALATLASGERLTPDAPAPSEALMVTEVVLGAVRDSDVLARVDEREFYLLLPETTGLGAHACRRRVLRTSSPSNDRRQAAARLHGVSMGVASFPHDGTSLSRLLRAAKRRADVTHDSVVARLRLDRMTLPEAVDALLWDADIAQGAGSLLPESPRAIELPLVDVLVLVVALMAEAARGGPLEVVVTQREGLGLLSGVRTHLSRRREEVTLHALDVRQHEGCEDLDVLAVIAEHGVYALLGRGSHGMFHGVHAADPLLADLCAWRLGDLAGVRVLE